MIFYTHPLTIEGVIGAGVFVGKHIGITSFDGVIGVANFNKAISFSNLPVKSYDSCYSCK
jgi:hypothetical protein